MLFSGTDRHTDRHFWYAKKRAPLGKIQTFSNELKYYFYIQGKGKGLFWIPISARSAR